MTTLVGSSPSSRRGIRSRTIEISDLVSDFARAIAAVNARHPVGEAKRFKPGVGPLTETELTEAILGELKETEATMYSSCGSRSYPGSRNTCDVVVPGHWAIELKLARPFGDNGKPAERWSENLLYPYTGNTSSLGDCLKLLRSGFTERKAVMVVGYEHVPAKIDLEPGIRSFELIASEVLSIRLGPRFQATVEGLVHPFHQRAYVFGWEVLGRKAGP